MKKTTTNTTVNNLGVSTDTNEYYKNVIDKDMRFSFSEYSPMSEYFRGIHLMEDIDVSDVIDEVNNYWNTVGKHHMGMFLSSDLFLMSYRFCRLSSYESVKPFEEIFGGELGDDTILNFVQNYETDDWKLSLINPTTKEMKIFEIDVELIIKNQNTKGYVDMITNYSKSSYKFNYEVDKYFEKNPYDILTVGFVTSHMVSTNTNVKWKTY